MSDIGLVLKHIKAASRDGLTRALLKYQFALKRRIEVQFVVEHPEIPEFAAWFYEEINLQSVAQAELDSLNVKNPRR